MWREPPLPGVGHGYPLSPSQVSTATVAARCWSMVTPLHPLRWALPTLLPGVGQWLPPFTLSGEHCHRCCQVLVNGCLLHPLRWALQPLPPGVGQWLSPLPFQVSIATIAVRCWSMVVSFTLSGEHCHHCCQVMVNGYPPSPSQVSTATVVARCWSMVTPSTLSGEHCHRCCKVLVNGWID